MTFKKIKEFEVKQGFKVTEYEHVKTGAKHHHSHVDGIENFFSIIFKTPVWDRKGIPHILEHIVLEGSKKYDVNNLFYKLMGKNFETFINAGTYPNFTTYYFGSNMEDGFLNLADVYLDATLNPLITEESFLQEGFRYERKDDNSLKFSGVVYNEMMAWVGKKEDMIDINLYETTYGRHPTYAYAGGNPLEISDVTHQDILDFHKKYYAPSNAKVYTTGSIDVAKIHAKLDEFFDKFERTEESVLPEIKRITDKYTIKTHYHTGDNVMSAYMLIHVGRLTLEEKTKLSRTISLASEHVADYFVDANKGLTLQYVSIDEYVGNNVIVAQFQLDNKEAVDILWKEWSFAWQTVVENGIDQEYINSIFAKEIAKEQSELEEGYAKLFNIRYFYNELTGKSDFIDNLMPNYIENTKKIFQNPQVITESINKYVLNQNNATVVVSIPDDKFIEKYVQKLTEKEKLRTNSYSADEQDVLVKRLDVLRAQQHERMSDSVLPEVKIDEHFSPEKLIPIAKNIVQETTINGAKIRNNIFDDEQNTASVKIQINFMPKNEEEIVFELIQNELFDYVDFKGMTRDETLVWKNNGLISLLSSIAFVYNDKKEIVLSKYLKVNGYKDNLKTLIEKAIQFDTIQNLSNKEDVAQFLSLLANEYNEFLPHVMDKNTREMAQVSAGKMSVEYIHMCKMVKMLNKISKEMENGDYSTYERLVAYYESKERKNAVINFVAMESDDGTMLNYLKDNMKFDKMELLTIEQVKNMIHVEHDISKNVALIAETPSAFTSTVIKNTPTCLDKENFIKMKLLGAYLGEYVLKVLRVEMGAYGANVIIQDGSVNLFTYRTPMPFESVEYYKNFIEIFLEEEINIDAFESAKRTLFAPFFKHNSKRKLAKLMDDMAFSNMDFVKEETIKIETLLKTTPDDIKEMARKYLLGKNGVTAICSNEAVFSKNAVEMEKVKYPFI